MEDKGKHVVSAFNCPNCGAAVDPDSLKCDYCRSAIAARVCPACFGSVSVGMRHCPHCGAHVPDVSAAKPATLSCPRCESGLLQVTVGTHRLHECRECGGLWLDKESLQEICAREEEQQAVQQFRNEGPQDQKPKREKPQRMYIPCPVCRKLMNHKNFSGCSGIVLDWCRNHGSWFDRTELQRIVMFIRDGGLRKAREREQSNLKEQESRLRMQQFEMASLERRLDSGERLESRSGADQLLQFFARMFLG